MATLRKINQYWKRLYLTLFAHPGNLNSNRQLLAFGIVIYILAVERLPWYL